MNNTVRESLTVPVEMRWLRFHRNHPVRAVLDVDAVELELILLLRIPLHVYHYAHEYSLFPAKDPCFGS